MPNASSALTGHAPAGSRLRASDSGASALDGPDREASSLAVPSLAASDLSVDARSLLIRATGLGYSSRLDFDSAPDLTPDPRGDLDVIFGASQFPVEAGAGTLYVTVGYDDEESKVAIPAPTAFTVKTLNVVSSAAPGTGESFTYTLRRDLSDTDLTVAVSGASTSGNADGTVAFARGQRLAIELVKSAGAPKSWHQWSIEIEFPD